MSDELQRGYNLAVELVDHLQRMGNASSCMIPVTDRAVEYVVIVQPKEKYDSERHALREAAVEADMLRMIRVGGDAVCEKCGKTYFSHEMYTGHLIDDGTGRQVPWLRVGCNGELLKL